MDIYNHYNGKAALFSFFIYVIMLIAGRRTFFGKVSRSSNYWFVFICMVVYSTLGFMEQDTYHYYELYKEMLSTGSQVHVEQFYYWLTMHIPRSYLLWRLIVFGSASLLMILSAKKLELNATILCFMVPLIFLRNLSTTRGSLGLALMVFCTILFVQSLEKRKVLFSAIAFLGLLACVFLHKSIVIFLAILIVSFFIPLNKRTLIVSLILFPVLYSFALRFFLDFPLFELLNEEQASLVSTYQSLEVASRNIHGIIFLVFEKTVLLLLLFIIIKKYLFDKTDASRTHFFIFKYTYILIYVSFLFLGQDISPWLNERTIHAASFALVLSATQCYDTYKTGKERTILEKIIIIGLLISTAWSQFYFMKSYW